MPSSGDKTSDQHPDQKKAHKPRPRSQIKQQKKPLLALYPFFLPPSTNKHFIFHLYTTLCPTYTKRLGSERDRQVTKGQTAVGICINTSVFISISIYLPTPTPPLYETLKTPA